MSALSASPTMAVMLEAQELRSRGIDVIDLGPGQPDFPTPESVKAAGIHAIEQDFTVYTPAAGIKELRQGIADQFNRKWGTTYSYENVIVTAGAKPAIYDVCMAAFDEGDEVLIPSPYWVTFPEVVKLAGASPRFLPPREDHHFILSLAEVQSALNSRTRGLIVNTPNNPTGAVIPGRTTGHLAGLAREQDLFLLFDETYADFTYGSEPHISLAKYAAADDFPYAVVGSFSKSHSMTGWRVGYCIGPVPLIRKINEFQSHQTGNPTSISQKAAVAALRLGEEYFGPIRSEYRRRRDLSLQAILDLPGFRCRVPEGAFYLFPNVEECMGRLGCTTSQEFSSFLLREARVATVPGSAFGVEGFIRLSYAASEDLLKEAFKRIRQAVEG